MTASQSNPEAETILSNSTHSWDEDLVLVGNDLFSPFFFSDCSAENVFFFGIEFYCEEKCVVKTAFFKEFKIL